MTYKVLVVGSGGHATNHWRSQLNIHEAFKVVGVVDTDTELLSKVGNIWGVPDDAVATTIDEAVELGITADIALICTPINTHHTIAVEAMRNGMSVICEKNMALSMQAGLEMTKCALDHPELATVVGHQYPFWRLANWAMRKAIGEGKLGKLDSIQCDFNRGGSRWNLTPPHKVDWRRFLDHSFLEDWAVHTIDLFRYFTAMDAVVVSADLWRPSWSRNTGDSSINIRMKMASPSEYEGEVPLSCNEQTDRARRLCENGKTPEGWVHGQYVGHAEEMGIFDHGEHWMIQGNKGSLEFMNEGYDTQGQKQETIRMITHDYPIDETGPNVKYPVKDINWTEADLKPYPVDLECGPAAQWKGDNTENEYQSGCFILEEVKQCIESGGKIKPTRCFENCIKTFAISMAAIESSKRGGQPIFLPDMWEIPRT
ncbi:MAG TPA: Gfo/Idh/MocA family oxidoreductase [Candidatus Lokiarchaeia archaeon]|nr:Gfo/Idh/MocA family oxidoreductase [Candidatus Lokiarchaeia archaeon]